MKPHVLANAKAYAALIGAICTALLGVYAADTRTGQVLTVLSIVATAVGTWRVPNTQRALAPDEGGQIDVGTAIVITVLLLVLLVLLGVINAR